MKKSFWMILMGLFVMSFGFVACGDDDDDDAGSGIVGTWTVKQTINEQEMSHSVECTVVFTASNYETTMIQEHSHNQNGGFRERFGQRVKGTYTLSGNTLTLNPQQRDYMNAEDGKDVWNGYENDEGGQRVLTIELSGKTLTLDPEQMDWWGFDSNKVTLTRK